MSPRTNLCKYIKDIIEYHERKVKIGDAICLHAENFIKDVDRLTPADKLFHFQRLISLNERATRPVLHILINFYPSEVISDQKMRHISQEFMEKWRGGSNPYLVYRHSDRSHPHIHIVSTVVDANGDLKRPTPNDLWNAWDITRELEEKWALIPAIRKNDWALEPPGRALPIDSREMALYPSMRNVLAEVLDKYRYTSLEEFNVLLRPYNMEAYAGRPGSFL
ncbi:MAG TPA: relaxase/mobilization nuclease domain-containing protein, partial [Puia sp.]